MPGPRGCTRPSAIRGDSPGGPPAATTSPAHSHPVSGYKKPRRDPFRPPVRAAFAAALVLLLAAAPARAHPIHTSVAEADYNAATGSLEVSLRVFIDDFEAALSVHARQRLSLGRTPAAEFDAATRAYLAEKFTVLGRDGKPAALRWVGREAKPDTNELWFHFELPMPGGVEGARVHHNALGEQFPNQINSVRVREAERQVTLVFLPRQTGKLVRFRP
ncbi:MAG: DUF6702 family protein [Opitutaceae bacterium]